MPERLSHSNISFTCPTYSPGLPTLQIDERTPWPIRRIRRMSHFGPVPV